MRTALTAATAAALFVGSALFLTPVAQASPDDGDCCPPACRADRCAPEHSGFGACPTPYPYSVRTDYRARRDGTSWSMLRRYLPNNRAYIRQQYVRRYFLRRSPYVLVQGKERETAEDLFRERGPDEILTTQQRLQRAMLNFHGAEYAAAQQEFTKLCADGEGEDRARLGQAVCALVRGQWSATTDALGAMALRGELRGEDRLDVEGTFEDAQAWERLKRGLAGYLRYQFMDADAQLCAAWSALLDGEANRALAHLSAARQWGKPTRLLETLEQLAKDDMAPRAEPASTPDEAPVPSEQPRAPGYSAILAAAGAVSAGAR